MKRSNKEMKALECAFKICTLVEQNSESVLAGSTDGEFTETDKEWYADAIYFNNWFLSMIKKSTIITTILIMLTVTGYSQFLNLEWPMRNVKSQNRDKELIWSAPDYLEYKTPGGYIAYEFTDKVCTTAFICLDSIAGDSLINSHLYKNWQPIAPDQWLYYAGYDEPVKVTADWKCGTVLFCYTLKK
jgi:hypothetical protein